MTAHTLQFSVEALPGNDDAELIVVTARCSCGAAGTLSYEDEDECETEIDRDCPALVALDTEGWPALCVSTS